MNELTVERAMNSLSEREIYFFDVLGRAMTPPEVFSTLIQANSRTIIMSKEKELSREMMTAITQYIKSTRQKRS
jgi:hypothetical protein